MWQDMTFIQYTCMRSFPVSNQECPWMSIVTTCELIHLCLFPLYTPGPPLNTYCDMRRVIIILHHLTLFTVHTTYPPVIYRCWGELYLRQHAQFDITTWGLMTKWWIVGQLIHSWSRFTNRRMELQEGGSYIGCQFRVVLIDMIASIQENINKVINVDRINHMALCFRSLQQSPRPLCSLHLSHMERRYSGSVFRLKNPVSFCLCPCLARFHCCARRPVWKLQMDGNTYS